MSDSQGVTLVTLTPTGWSRFNQYFVLRWVLRYTSFYNAFRRFLGRSKRIGNPGPVLEALNFIHFGRWVIVQQHPLRRWKSSGLPEFDDPRYDQAEEESDHGLMLFMSNFDDEWPGYVDTFMEATLDDLGVFWKQTPGWREPTKAGFEGFFTFVDDHKIDHTHYYTAYPGLATSDIKAALAVDRHVRSFAIHTEGMKPEEWDLAFNGLVSKLQHSLGRIDWERPIYPPPIAFAAGSGAHLGLTSLAPFPTSDVETLEASITANMNGRLSPFAAVAGTHFARLTVINSIREKTEGRQLKSGYVLMSVDADGSLGQGDAWLSELFDVWSNINPPGPSPNLIDLVWGSCYGFGVGRSRQEFLDYIAATSFKATVPFADYPYASLWDVYRALHTHQWFTDFVFARAADGGPGPAEFEARLAVSPLVDVP
jgi:hypothetical protein